MLDLGLLETGTAAVPVSTSRGLALALAAIPLAAGARALMLLPAVPRLPDLMLPVAMRAAAIPD